MKSPSPLSNEALLLEIKQSVLEERRSTTRVLHQLREIEARKLHLKRGYASLHEFAVRELGYSDGGAHRRINAMRLLKDLPEIEAKLESGELTLTTAAKIQNFAWQEKRLSGTVISPEQKIQLIEESTHLSTRECERKLMALASDPVKQASQQRETPVSPTETRISFTADEELTELLKRFREVTSHRDLKTLNEELKLALKTALKTLDPAAKPAKTTSAQKLPQEPAQDTPSEFIPAQSRWIPTRTRAEVWQTHQSRCSYVDSKTQRRCEARSKLEVDHLDPYAYGGSHAQENLRLLCRPHHHLRHEARPQGM